MRSLITRSGKITQEDGLPFIVLNLPFVGLTLPAIKPPIGNDIPSIGFRRFLGFTLIELMITLVIAAVILGLAFPNLRQFVQNNRLRTEASELFAAINKARTEAKTNGVQVSLCVSSDQISCTGATWDLGWLAWVDTNSSGVVDVGEQILRVRPGPENGINLSSAGGTVLTFSPGGAATGALNFRVCDDSRTGEEGRDITINATSGNARLSCLSSATGTLCTIKPEKPIDVDNPQCT